MRTQVVIIGSGPSGLLLSHHLHQAGIDNIILERKSKQYVLGRIRAGVLEVGLTNQLRDSGVGTRLDKEGYVHDGTILSYGNEQIRIDLKKHTGSHVTVYGQTEVTRDLFNKREEDGGKLIFEVEGVQIHNVETNAPSVSYLHDGKQHEIKCQFVAGCDGFHGVSRQTIPKDKRREFEKVYPFGWLGILSETPPVYDELIYSNSKHGFALCSMRNENLSRYYIQCETSDNPANWSDDAFWEALKKRIPEQYAETLITGPSIEKSIAPLRSFVCEPMQWGNLFLCGDAAHIVPPTGAKGLNTAASDVYYLSEALKSYFIQNDDSGLKTYSIRALDRIWKAERFSWWMTSLLHQFPGQNEFDRRMQKAELDFLKQNEAAQAVLAQNYVGLPY